MRWYMKRRAGRVFEIFFIPPSVKGIGVYRKTRNRCAVHCWAPSFSKKKKKKVEYNREPDRWLSLFFLKDWRSLICHNRYSRGHLTKVAFEKGAPRR